MHVQFERKHQVPTAAFPALPSSFRTMSSTPVQHSSASYVSPPPTRRQRVAPASESPVPPETPTTQPEQAPAQPPATTTAAPMKRPAAASPKPKRKAGKTPGEQRAIKDTLAAAAVARHHGHSPVGHSTEAAPVGRGKKRPLEEAPRKKPVHPKVHHREINRCA